MRKVSLLALAGIMSVGAVSTRARADDVADLKAEVAQLKSQVSQLQTKQQDTDAEQAQIEKEVLQDADQHSALLDTENVNAGFDIKRGFFIKSDDGNFLLHPILIAQIRYDYDYRSAGKASSGGPDNQEGFELRRAKFGVDGYAFSPDFTYKFQWQDGDNGGSPTLEYGWAKYVFDKNALLGGDLAAQVGQIKNPIWKEEAIVGDTAQLAIERSLANTLVGGNSNGGALTQAAVFSLTGKTAPLHFDVAFTDGDNQANEDFTNGNDNTAATIKGNFGGAARVDYKFFGDWSDTSELTGVTAVHDLLDIGGGITYGDSEFIAPAVGGQNLLRGTIDAQYTIAKTFTAFGALYGDHYDYRNDPAIHKDSRNDWGAVVQGGYFVNSNLEPYLRYSFSGLDQSFKSGGEADFSEITAGVNVFFGPDAEFQNHVKLSFDATYLPNGVPSESGLDYLASPNGNESLVFRSQLTVIF
jgi:hypothetical protein